MSAPTAQLLAALAAAVALVTAALIAAAMQAVNLGRQLRATRAERGETQQQAAATASQTFTAEQMKLLYDGQWQRIDDLKSETAALKAELAEHARRLAEREAQVETLREDMAQIKVIERILRQENTQLRERVQKLTEENTQLHARVAGLEQRLTEQTPP